MSLGTWLRKLFTRDTLRPSVLPDHEGGVRRMYSDSHGLEYRPLRTLADARALPDGSVILSAGCALAVCGGATAPAASSRVACTASSRLHGAAVLEDGEGAAAGGTAVFRSSP